MPTVITITDISVFGLGHRFFGRRHQSITDLITNHPIITPAITHRLIIHAIITNGFRDTGSGIAIGAVGFGFPATGDMVIEENIILNKLFPSQFKI